MSPASSSWPQPLAGVRILDFSLLLPGPYCTHLLTEMGAETIKVEPPTGDPARLMSPAGFGMANRGKQSVCVDASAPASTEFLLRLAAECDVMVEGFRPGIMQRMGLSFEQVRERNPNILYVSISAYGQDGPYAARPAHDVNTIAAAGYFATTLDADHATLQRPRLRIADYLGGMYPAFYLASLLRTPRSERSAMHLDASLFDAMAYAMLPTLLTSTPAELDDPTQRNDVLADVALYRLGDGRAIAFATLEDKFWTAFVAALGARFPELQNPAWARRGGRTRDKQALRECLMQLFAQLTLAEVEQLLPPESVCWSPVLDGREVLADPHLQARGLLQVQPGASATITSAAAINGVRAPATADSPTLGQHTALWRERMGLPVSA